MKGSCQGRTADKGRMLADQHRENIGILGIMRPRKKKKKQTSHVLRGGEATACRDPCEVEGWRSGGDLIDEAVWERCKRVQDCGPGGMLCLWQR